MLKNAGHKIFRAAALLILAALLASGCRSRETAAVMGDTVAKETVVEADPQTAVDKIYGSLKEPKAVPLSKWRVTDTLGIKESDLLEVYGKISDPSGGLADIAILLPKKSAVEDVTLALSKYKELRIAEFENYDILDAYSIAQNAVIYSQGDYVIMLMLSDNDSARAIIDEYIPL